MFRKKIERFDHSLFLKWSTLGDSLRLLTKNEWPWVHCSGCAPKMSEWLGFFLMNRSFANFFAKNKRFALKTNERIPNPAFKQEKAENYFFSWHLQIKEKWPWQAELGMQQFFSFVTTIMQQHNSALGPENIWNKFSSRCLYGAATPHIVILQ